MKKLEIKTNKRLLIVELPENGFSEEKTIKAFIDSQKYINTQLGNNVELKFICKGSDLTEDIAKGFIDFKWMPTWGAKDYVNENNHFTSALESFISAIQSKNYHWGENPVKRPIKDDSECAKWHIKAFEKKQNEWRESESRTFNPSKCIIFEII